MGKSHRTIRYLEDDDWAVLERVCEEAGVAPDIVERMIAEENKVYGMGRRHGIWEMLEALVAEGVQHNTHREVHK